MSRLQDAAKFLAVDMHQLSWLRPLVADDLLARRSWLQVLAAMTAQDAIDSRRRKTDRPADHVRSCGQLAPRAQHDLLHARRCLPRTRMRPRRAIRHRLATTTAIHPLRRRLTRTADPTRRRRDRHTLSKLAQPPALARRQRRVSMNLHSSPPRPLLDSRDPRRAR